MRQWESVRGKGCGVWWTNFLRFIAAFAAAITAINWSLYSLQHQWHIAVTVAVAIAVSQSLWALHCRPGVFGRRFAVQNDETEPLSIRVPDWLRNCGGQVRQCTRNGLDHRVRGCKDETRTRIEIGRTSTTVKIVSRRNFKEAHLVKFTYSLGTIEFWHSSATSKQSKRRVIEATRYVN